MEARNCIKRGLVLEGGGAKGAYAFGALKAFADHGIKFDAVAGTSVGALNAALWSTGQLGDLGTEIWENIDQDRIYPWRRPRWLMYLSLPLILLAHANARFAAGHSVDWLINGRSFGWLVNRLLALCYLLPVAAAAMVFLLMLPYHPSARLLTYLVVCLLIALAVEFVVSARHLRTVHNGLLWGCNFLVLGIALAIYERTSVPVLFLCALAGLSHWLVTMRLSKRTLLTSAPLEALISAVVAHEMTIPTFATLALQTAVFDPDDPKYISSDPENPDATIWAAPEGRVVPHYVEISRLPRDDCTKALLASAALPYGIVPSVCIQDQHYEDGGTADNVPLYPLISLLHCDEIIVVRLCRGAFDYLKGGYKEEWRRIDRLRRLAAFTDYDDSYSDWSEAKYTKRNKPPTAVPFRDPPSWPHVQSLRPKGRLGGFISGTVNFDPSYGRELMTSGYEDAVRFIGRKQLARDPGSLPSSASDLAT